MPDSTTATQPATPDPKSAAPAAPAAKPPTPPPAAAPANEPKEEPAWLKDRLERQERSLLKKLGFDDVDGGKKAVDELKKRRDSEKTETERLKDENKALKKDADEATELRTALEGHATVALAALTDDQRAVVQQIAGDSPAKQLKTIETLKPTWSTQGTPSAPAAASPPATTTQTAPAPAGAAPPSENLLAQYEDLQEKNPLRASHFYLANALAIEKASKART